MSNQPAGPLSDAIWVGQESCWVSDSGWTWANFLKAVVLFAAVPVVLFLGVFIMVVIQEWDSAYKMRLARANSDMRVIEFAAALYTKRYGHLPTAVADLAPGSGRAPGDVCFLPMIPSSPWNTPYHFEIEHAPGGDDKLKVWTVPDQKTQDKTHLARFYPDLNVPKDAWPGDPESATEDQKAGIPCDRIAAPFREHARTKEPAQTGIQGAAPTDDAAVLAATLDKLNLENPIADLDTNLSRGDKRLIGLNGYSRWPPDVDQSFDAVIHRFGVSCLPGTSDYIQSDRHEALMWKATEYANRYNWALLHRIRGAAVK